MTRASVYFMAAALVVLTVENGRVLPGAIERAAGGQSNKRDGGDFYFRREKYARPGAPAAYVEKTADGGHFFFHREKYDQAYYPPGERAELPPFGPVQRPRAKHGFVPKY